MRFDQDSPFLGKYHWGTLFCSFSSSIDVHRRFGLENLGALLSSSARWESDSDFRAFVTWLHELAHMAQDLTTGIGHWDHVVRSNSIDILLYSAGSLSREYGVRPPYVADDFFNFFYESTIERLKYRPWERVLPSCRENIRKAIEADLGGSVSDAALFDISVQAMLESDAASAVGRILRRLRGDSVQREIAKRNEDLFSEFKLGELYWRSKLHVTKVLQHHCQTTDLESYEIGEVLFSIIVDSALAHPPMEWISKMQRKEIDFDPSVKFCRLLSAFQRLVGSDMDEFARALIVDRRYLDAEKMLIMSSTYEYPASDEIYESWLSSLKHIVPDSRVAELRRIACEHRLRSGVIMKSRDVYLLTAIQAPFLNFTPDGGFVKTDWGPWALDLEKSGMFMAELLDHFTSIELINFLFRTGNFRCPYSAAAACSVAEDSCFAGHTTLSQIPDSDLCGVRAMLVRSGFQLPS